MLGLQDEDVERSMQEQVIDLRRAPVDLQAEVVNCGANLIMSDFLEENG